MASFVKVAKTTELSDPAQMLLEVEDRIVVLCRVGGEFFCIDDVCTHDGGPLSEGRLDDHTIACPRHGAKFDIRTGKALTMPATVDTAAHEVKITGDDVLVRLCQPGELAKKQTSGATKETAAPAIAAPGQAVGPVDTATNPKPARAADLGQSPSAAGNLNEDLVREELKKVV